MQIFYPGLTLESAEKIIIKEAFQFYRGEKKQTASSLGMSIKTLDTKLEKYEAEQADEDRRREEERFKRQEFIQRQRNGFPSTSPGLRVEPAFETRSESTMSLHERKEVQEVLPKHTSKGSSKRASAGI